MVVGALAQHGAAHGVSCHDPAAGKEDAAANLPLLSNGTEAKAHAIK